MMYPINVYPKPNTYVEQKLKRNIKKKEWKEINSCSKNRKITLPLDNHPYSTKTTETREAQKKKHKTRAITKSRKEEEAEEIYIETIPLHQIYSLSPASRTLRYSDWMTRFLAFGAYRWCLFCLCLLTALCLSIQLIYILIKTTRKKNVNRKKITFIWKVKQSQWKIK